MLLHIENIAVIEKADITFQGGFNALTGETGAGKSIVIDALGAVLGQRISRDLVRTGADRACVSAVFSNVEALLPFLQEQGCEPDEDGLLLLRRDIQADGKSVCRINDRPCTAAQLRRVGMALLNIHGQHDGQQLLDEKEHIRYLDSFGKVDAPMAAYRNAYDALRKLHRQMESLRIDEAERERRIDTLQREIAELERAQLKEGEEDGLLERRNLLRNSEKYISAVEGADYCLNGGDERDGAVSQVAEAENALSGARQFGETFVGLLRRLSDVRHELYDIAETVRDMKDQFEFSPVELDEIEGRLDRLYRLKKKYGPTEGEMIAYLERARQELDEIQYAGDTLAQLEKQYGVAEQAAQEAAARLSAARRGAAEELQRRILAEIQYAGDTLAQLEKQYGVAEQAAQEAAARLSAARRGAAEELQRRILAELRDLDMHKVRFEIAFEDKPLEADGGDRVRFLMSANVGEELRPIHKIASGGELARIMLALKNVLAETDHVGTLVFDEVDTGVSGRAAQKVGEKMAQVSRRKQVLCVTHLPQIAAMADVHFSVEKGEEQGRTYTRIHCLDRQQREAELARITGGARITDALLQSAGEMLDAAQVYRNALK